MRAVVLLLLIVPAFAIAKDKQVNEKFAMDMLSCSYENSTYAMGPGDPDVAKKAEVDSAAYLAAAEKATSHGFVEAHRAAANKSAEHAVMQQIAEARTADVLMKAWGGMKARCDSQMKTFAALK